MDQNPVKVSVIKSAAANNDVSAKAVPAEHIAAIAAAVAAVYAGIPEEHLVAIAAALAAYDGSIQMAPTLPAVPIVRLSRGQKAWTIAGRQEVMAARKFS